MATYLPTVTDVLPEPALYTPDFSFLDTMLRRRQALYEQGFSQVSSAYNFVNRDVTNPYNAQARDKYLAEAKNRLKNLSTMDLSQRQNVAAASSVFEPFYSNKSVLGDQAVTAHWNQQEAIAESYRLRDGGKEFSEDNINYVRIQREQFRNDAPDAWSSYYNNKRSYTPYYNWSEEVTKAMEKFKPSSIKTVKKDGFYIIEETDKGAKANDIYRYLGSVLSDKARNQMRIEASVRLGGNPQNLAMAYTQVASERLSAINNNIGQLSEAIKTEKKDELKTTYQQMRDKLMEEAKDISGQLDKISKNDLSEITKNPDKLAYSIYFDNTIKRLADGYRYEDRDMEIKFDQVAMMIYRESQEWARHNENKQLKLLELQGKNGNALPVGIPSGPEDVVTRSLSDVNENITAVNGQMANLTNQMKEHIAQIKKIPVNKVTDKDVDAYISSDVGKKDKWVTDNYTPSLMRLRNKVDLFNSEISAAEKSATAGMTAEEIKSIGAIKNQITNLGGSITIGGVTYTPEMIFKEIVDKKNKPSEVGNRAGATTFTWSVNGQNIRGVVSGPSADPNVRALRNLVTNVENIVSKNKSQVASYNKYNNKVVDYFGTKQTQIRTGLNFGDDSKQVKEAKSYLGGLLPNNYQAGSISGVIHDPTNGRLYFSLSGTENKPVDEQSIVSSLVSQGLKAGYNKAAGKFYVEGSRIPGTDMYFNLTPTELDILKVGQQAQKGFSSVAWWPSGTSDAKGNALPGFRYEKRVDANGNSSYYLYTDGVASPIRNQRYDDLYTLMIDAKLLSMRPDKLNDLIGK